MIVLVWADTALDRGMIITQVHYKNVGSAAEFHAAVAAAERTGRSAVLLHVQAPNGQVGDVAVRVSGGQKD